MYFTIHFVVSDGNNLGVNVVVNVKFKIVNIYKPSFVCNSANLPIFYFFAVITGLMPR